VQRYKCMEDNNAKLTNHAHTMPRIEVEAGTPGPSEPMSSDYVAQVCGLVSAAELDTVLQGEQAGNDLDAPVVIDGDIDLDSDEELLAELELESNNKSKSKSKNKNKNKNKSNTQDPDREPQHTRPPRRPSRRPDTKAANQHDLGDVRRKRHRPRRTDRCKSKH
jgi:hypothetical protein